MIKLAKSGLGVQVFAATIFLLIFCEFLVYYIVQSSCEWPELNPTRKNGNIKHNYQAPVKAMIIADTHLLGSRRGHWFDKLRREWQMYRAFQTAMTLHKPDLVFVLGDVTDEGLFCGKEEFEYYVRRFYTLFAVPSETKLFVVVGNHDIGFHYGIRPALNSRFVSAFESPPVQLISLRGNYFVLLNSMALEGDGCFLCKPAEMELNRIEKILMCANGTLKQCASIKKLKSYSRPILMQHYPLYRRSDEECTDYDAAPESIKSDPFRERWECLSKEATDQVLRQIHPRLVFSGHTHHGCTRALDVGDGIEITIPSFSWRNKNNPNYGMAVFSPDNYSFVKCDMPRESTVVRLYIIGVTSLFLWIIYSFYRRRQHRKCN